MDHLALYLLARGDIIVDGDDLTCGQPVNRVFHPLRKPVVFVYRHGIALRRSCAPHLPEHVQQTHGFDPREHFRDPPVDYIHSGYLAYFLTGFVDVSYREICSVLQGLVHGHPTAHVVEEFPIFSFTFFQIPEQQIIRPRQTGLDNGFVDETEGDDFEDVSDKVGEAIRTDVECQGDFGTDRHQHRGDQQIENVSVELPLFSPQQDDRGQEDRGDDVFAGFLEDGQSGSFDKARREILPVEDGAQHQSNDHRVEKHDRSRFEPGVEQ